MKYIIAIFITAAIVFLGATFYYKGIPKFPMTAANPTATEVATVAPTPTPIASTTVKAGGILVFKAYTINVPNDWTYKKEGAPSGDIEVDKLILTKTGYKITIYEAATGGAPCLYPGEPDVEGPMSRFTAFVEFKTATGDKLRRGSVAGTSNFTVCEEQQGGFGEPTSFGHISVVVPSGGATAAMLTEIDGMLSSLKKI